MTSQNNRTYGRITKKPIGGWPKQIEDKQSKTLKIIYNIRTINIQTAIKDDEAGEIFTLSECHQGGEKHS